MSPAQPASPRKSSVLVVDDDPAFQRIAEATLASMGLTSVCVRSAEEALRLIGDEPPRAVLLDGLLPGMRGDELAKRLRERFGNGELRIVFVSAFFRDLKSRTHLLQSCGVDMVLHKPIAADELRQALSRLPDFAPAPDDHPGLAQELDLEATLEMTADYLSQAREQVSEMRQALRAMGRGADGPSLEAIRRHAHQLYGSGASYGFPEISRLARLIEHLAATSRGPLSAASSAQLAGLVEALADKVERTSGELPIDTESSDRQLEVWLVDGPGELWLSCTEAASRGVPVRAHADVASVLAAAPARPDVLFVALGHTPIESIDRLVAAGLGPIVVLSRDGSHSARLQAVRAGAAGFLPPLPDAAALFRAARMFARVRDGATVLAADEDRQELAELATQLAPHRLSVEPCLRPESLFDELDRVQPASLVLSLDLAGGLDLLRAVRADLRWRRLPVVALSADDGPAARMGALEAGADDFVARPWLPRELAARVRACAERSLAEQRVATVDSLTGAFAEPYLKDACERAVALARRGRPLALMLFDAGVAALPRVEADEVRLSLAARLRRAFRSSDVVAWLGGGRFAVLLYDIDRPSAERLLSTTLASLEGKAPGTPPLLARVRAGLATFPDTRGGYEELLEAASVQLGGGR